jgi:hypothetical protein
MTMTRTQYRASGRRFASGAVADECGAVDLRWVRDLPVLAPFGYTQRRRTEFNALRAEHAAKRNARPALVAAKIEAIKNTRGLITTMNAWLDRANSNLGLLAMDHDAVTAGVAAIAAKQADGPDAVVAATVDLLRTHKDAIDPDVNPDALIAEGAGLVERIRAAIPAKKGARDATIADTEEIDVLDGRLLEIIAGLNSAGRKAFRALKNTARVNEYKYHFVRGKPSETADDAPPETPQTPA